MKLNHINLPVSDVSQAKDFLTTYFGLRCLQERGRNVIAIMCDDDGLILTLSHFDKATSDVTYPRDFHVGFTQENRKQVTTIYERFKADGFNVEPPRDFHGSWTFYLQAPGGFVVEVQAME